MEPSGLNLTVAALAGAAVAAVASYCMHRETVSRILDFARERDRHVELAAADRGTDPPNPNKKGIACRKCRRQGIDRRRRVRSGDAASEISSNGSITGVPVHQPLIHSFGAGAYDSGSELSPG